METSAPTRNIGELAQTFIDALRTLEDGGGVDRIVSLFADDASLTNPALMLAGAAREGRGGAQAFWTEYGNTFSEAHSDFHRVTVDGDAAGLFWTTRAAGHDHQTMAYDGVSLLVFDGAGKIKSFRGYYDTHQLGRQLRAADAS